MNDNLNLESSESQNKKILKYLQNGNRITALEALNLFGCFRLASRINDIKSLGHTIKGEFITLPNGKRVKQYYL